METMHGTNVQKEMRHIINLLCVCFVAFSMASCGGNSSSDKERIAQLEDSIARMQAKQQSEISSGSRNEPSRAFASTSITEYESTNGTSANFLGTYKVTDVSGRTFYFILNEDETANVKAEGSDEILYCSWTELFSINKGIRIGFSDKRPIVYFDGGVKEYGSMYLKDGWLYAGSSEVESKHPKWRLKAEQIK